MKFNKWTVGLAAVGVVSLASAARAEEKMSAVQTALSSTTLSGYVDTSMQWNFGTGNANNPPYSFGGQGKADGFNLNVVQLSLDKPLDESQWAAGYHVDLWFGPDAGTLGTDTYFGNAGNFGIRQAYVALRMPIGNGLDWKIGVFDTVIGYETLAAGSNPNYTRSYGFTMEPTTHTGALATYRFCDTFTASAGIANTTDAQIDGRTTRAESYKTYMASMALTAPQSFGSLAGSTLYAGVVNGVASTVSNPRITNWYLGATVATPVAGLKAGVSFDYRHIDDFDTTPYGSDYAVGFYASYQATEKMSLHGRVEYANLQAAPSNTQYWDFTATVQYDLWQNVLTRLEFRWDNANGYSFGGDGVGSPGTNPNFGPNRYNAYMLAANIIYKF